MRNPITPDLIAFKRAVTESIYTGRMTVLVPEYHEDPESGFRRETLRVLYEDVPCRCIAQHIETLQEHPSQSYRMDGVLCAPELRIPAGSRLRITFNGRTDDYRITSESQMYTGHQRINTRLYDKEDKYYA